MAWLAKASFTALLMIASMILGLLGVGWVVASVISIADNPRPPGFGAVCGLVAIAAGFGLMRWARHLERHTAYGAANPDGQSPPTT